MNTPGNLKYTKEHEWASIEENIATIGITDFAQNSLGDIVFVELPEVGSEINAGDSIGVVESIKSVSDLYSPFSGTILEVNETLNESPESINESAYTQWIFKMNLNNLEEISKLLNAQDYDKHCQDSH